MARKKSKGQLNISFPKFKDERIYKLLGLFCIFIALYLFIAFTSYLFTWQTDQSLVLEHSWGFLYEGEIGAANWLGRLGAIVSNMFFYWGFGLPAFIFVYVFGKLGMNTIKERPFSDNVPMFWNGFILLLFLSILAHFIFQTSGFPYGGAFGKATTTWLLKFIGTVGLIALLIFTGFTAFIWANNPNFNELTFEKVVADIRFFFEDLFSGNLTGKKKKRKPRVAAQRETSTSGGLLPRNSSASKATSTASTELEVSTGETGSAAPTDKKPAATPEVEEGQLALNLAKKKREKPQTLRSGEAEMEISAPKPFVKQLWTSKLIINYTPNLTTQRWIYLPTSIP